MGENMVNKKPNVIKIIRQMFSHPKDFVFFVLFSVLLTGFAIASVVVMGKLIDAYFLQNAPVKISLYVVPLTLLVISFAGSYVTMARFKSGITAAITKELKEEAYYALLQAEMSEFDKDNYEKEVKQFVKNVEFVSEIYIGKNLLAFVTMMSILIGFGLTALIIQPVFGLITLLMMSLYATADKTATVLSSKTANRYEEELKNNSEITFSTIKNLKNIKLLSGIDSEADRYAELNNELANATHARNVTRIVTKYVLPFLFVGIIYAILLGVGGLMQADGTVSIDSYICYSIIVPIITICTYHALHYHLKTSYVEKEAADIEKIINLRSELRSEPITSLDDLYNIKFDNVGIGKDDNTLNGISFEIRQGERIGILAMSKDSRDSLFDLFTKIEKPEEGIITINNCELNKINAKYLRTLIAPIYDDSHVFNDTIENNICYASEFDEYKYNDALYRSGLKQIIANFEEKDQKMLDGTVKDDLNMRVIYAHAFYQDAKIYLLKDTCNDAALESLLVGEVMKLKNKTVIIITDKPYLLNKCDKIMIMEDGKIVETGVHKELLSDKQSNYYRLIKGNSGRKTKVS